MNEKYSFQRFWTYFKYDIVQMWRHNGKAALVLGGAGVILYVIHVLFSLLFPPHVWQAPSVEARGACYGIATLAFILFQARTYGYLTEKRAGSSWLMLPASASEKTVSMLLMTLVALPLAFVVVFLGTDALICLLDPTAGESLFKSQNIYALTEDGSILVPFIINIVFATAAALTYFLLSGIVFKKWKIVGGIAVLFCVMTLAVFIVSALVQSGVISIEMSEEVSKDAFKMHALWSAAAISVLVWAGLAWGVYHRVKTLKH